METPVAFVLALLVGYTAVLGIHKTAKETQKHVIKPTYTHVVKPIGNFAKKIAR